MTPPLPSGAGTNVQGLFCWRLERALIRVAQRLGVPYPERRRTERRRPERRAGDRRAELLALVLSVVEMLV